LGVLVSGLDAVKRRADLAAGVAACLGTAAGPPGLPAPAAASGLGAHCTHFEAERARRSREEILAVAVNSRGHDEARTALLPQFVDWFDPEDARLLLTDWVGDEPGEPAPLRLRARLELRLGNFGSSL